MLASGPVVGPSRKLSRRFVAAAIALGLTAPAAARAQVAPEAPEKISVGDWKLTPLAEVRVRGEVRHDPPDQGGLDLFGRFAPRVRNSATFSERARLGLGAERGGLRAQITLQDARALGVGVPSAAISPDRGPSALGAYEAYLELRRSGARPTWLRVGRQAVEWGEGRLLGKADFSPTGRSLDALRVHWTRGKVDVELLGALLESGAPLGAAFSDSVGPSRSGVQLAGASGTLTLHPLFVIDLFALARISRSGGFGLDGSRFSIARLSGETYTGALRVSGDGSGWSYGVEGAYQLGNAAGLGIGGSDVSAYAGAARLSKRFDQVLMSPKLGVGAAYASGDDGSGTYKQFDPILADPQRFHGQVDFLAWSNLAEVSARTEVVPWSDATFALEYRYAHLAQAQGDWIGSYLNAVGRSSPTPAFVTGTTATPVTPATTGETELGHELDAVLSVRPWAPFELRAGYSIFLMGAGAKAVLAAHARGTRLQDNSISPSSFTHYGFLQAAVALP